MISIGEYFGPWLHHPDVTDERMQHAGRLVAAVNRLMERAQLDGVPFPVNPATGSQIGGQRYGGFRPQSCTVGAPNSNHKMGLAVDLFDPSGAIDAWCLENLPLLEECGIWIEYPDDTDGWSHWACVPPRSGKRVFRP